MELTLKVQKREILGRKAKELRRQEQIPGIIYGHGIKSIPIKIDKHSFIKLFQEAGETTIISLELDGAKSYDVLVHGVQKDPVSDEIIHVDFYKIKSGEEMTVEVPLVFEGEAPAVKDLGGILVTNLREITVKALPKNLPHDIKLNLAALKDFDQHLTVADLPRLEGVKYLADDEEVIALVEPPRSQQELDALSEEVKEEVSEVEGVADKEEQEEKEAEGEALETENKT